MKEKKHNLLAEEFQITWVATAPSGRWSELPTPYVWAAWSDFCPKTGEIVTLECGKPTDTASAPCSRSISTVRSPVPWI